MFQDNKETYYRDKSIDEIYELAMDKFFAQNHNFLKIDIKSDQLITFRFIFYKSFDFYFAILIQKD